MEPMSGCWLWDSSLSSRGYGVIKRNYKKIKAHRAAYELFVGEIPVGLFVLHKCDVPSCVNPDHLFLGTNSDNMQDMLKKGRQPDLKGEKNPSAKLNPAKVKCIKILLGDKSKTQQEIANIYSIGRTVISDIKRGKTWSDVTIEGHA